MKRVFNFIGSLLVTLSLVFLFIKLTQNLNEVPSFNLTSVGLLSIALASVFCACIVLVISAAWNVLLRGAKVYISFQDSYIILGKSQIGKYIPGNVFQYAGRVVIGHEYKIPTSAAVLGITTETALLTLTGAAIALTGFFLDRQPYQRLLIEFNIQSIVTTTALVFGAAASLIAIAWFIAPARAWLKRHLTYLHIGRIAISVALYTMVFVLFGLSISLLLEVAWGIDTNLRWYQFVWGFAAAWVVGFVTPGAPAGVGIRETIFTSLYAQELGEGLAIGLSLLLRVVTSLGDLTAFGFAYYLDRSNPIRK
jgi:hypothetical protein